MKTSAVPMKREVSVMPSMRSAWVKIMKQMRAQSSTMLVIWNLDKGFFMKVLLFNTKPKLQKTSICRRNLGDYLYFCH